MTSRRRSYKSTDHQSVGESSERPSGIDHRRRFSQAEPYPGIFIIDHSKKMAACRFYRDPLRKVDFICSKTVIRLIF